MFLADASVTWQATIVAVAIIGAMTIIMVVAMKLYPLGSVLKIWAALGPLTGIIVGAVSSYFFVAKPQIDSAQNSAVAAQASNTKFADLAEKVHLGPLSKLSTTQASQVLHNADLPQAATRPATWIENVKQLDVLSSEMRRLGKKVD